MRKPNGYGTVYKLKGNRRKPWCAAVTTEFYLEVDGVRVKASEVKPNDKVKAHRTRHSIGYFRTRREAEDALAVYNSDPYELGLTFAQVYEKWHSSKNISTSTMSSYEKAHERFKSLHDKRFADIKVGDLETAINGQEISQKSKVRMKQLLNQLYKYAMRYDMVHSNLSERFAIQDPKPVIERRAFTDEEILALWENGSNEANITLILIYTGVRIAELYSMEIDRENWLLKGGLKTEAGKNRVVPIREKIKPLMDFDRLMTKDAFYQRVLYFLRKINHTPHDARVTFATRYKYADETAVKLILGHAVKDVTKGIYTKYTPDDLRQVIESVDF